MWGLRRHAAGLPSELRPIEADLSDRATLERLPGALDCVVFAAAPEASDPTSYRRVYIDGLANVLGAVRGHAPAALVVLLSSTSVYGQNAAEWVDESSPTEPPDFRGDTMLRAERALAESGLRSIALRLGGLYGPGRASLIEAVRSGRATATPGPGHFSNRIHRDDAVGAILHLVDLPAARSVYVGVDEEPADRNQVVRWLGARLGVAAPETTAAATPDRAVDSSPAVTGKRCSSALLRASGYRFRYPSYREGYAALLADAR